MRYTVAILTISDKGSVGEREDKSGPALRKMLENSYDVKEMSLYRMRWILFPKP